MKKAQVPELATYDFGKEEKFLKKKRFKYKSELPKLIYTFFVNYQDAMSAPSFQKFARSIGTTTAELSRMRSHEEFNRAWEECNEIRRDYLEDRALTKKFDPSFVKFLLSEGNDAKADAEDSELSVTLRVQDDGA